MCRAAGKSLFQAIKSLLNFGLITHHNRDLNDGPHVMTGEDLCTVGVVGVQSDLALVAALGLEHVERNGRHYHPGLSYLPLVDQQKAMAAHPDFYAERHDCIAPVVRDGKFQLNSLNCVGYGFSCLPDLDDYESPADWQFESLGLGVS